MKSGQSPQMPFKKPQVSHDFIAAHNQPFIERVYRQHVNFELHTTRIEVGLDQDVPAGGKDIDIRKEYLQTCLY